MNKEDILKILEGAKDKNGDVPMRLVRQAFEKLSEPCTDTISRQAAIDVLNVGAELLNRVLDDADIVGVERAKYEWGLGLIESYIYDMKELPSAQPEVLAHGEGELSAQPEPEEFEWCHDCKEYDREAHCCHRWTNVIRKTVDEIKAEQRWIPCSERLPKAEKEVFVYLFGDIPYIAWVDKNGVWNTEDFEVEDDNRPVAWMSLPKPYKGEQE